jgi:hypothetical protein
MAPLRRTLQEITPDSLTAYLAGVRRKRVLSPEEEVALARRKLRALAKEKALDHSLN